MLARGDERAHQQQQGRLRDQLRHGDPVGNQPTALDDALFAGRSAVRSTTLDVAGMDSLNLAVARCDFDGKTAASASRVPLDRGCAMALAAARNVSRIDEGPRSPFASP